MTLLDIFRAGRCRRWHRHPVMVDTDDRLDGHQGRVARLALALFPDDHDLLIMALTHDDGESVTGDIPNPVKNQLSQVARDAIEDMEENARLRLWGGLSGSGKATDIVRTATRLRLCDKLDAIMWVAHHHPRLLAEPGWQSDIAEVKALAAQCGATWEALAALLREIAPE